LNEAFPRFQYEKRVFIPARTSSEIATDTG
jgi:hypothetical protein